MTGTPGQPSTPFRASQGSKGGPSRKTAAKEGNKMTKQPWERQTAQDHIEAAKEDIERSGKCPQPHTEAQERVAKFLVQQATLALENEMEEDATILAMAASEIVNNR